MSHAATTTTAGTTTAGAGRWACSWVEFADLTAPKDLIAAEALDTVFTRRERLLSGAGAGLTSWAGRLAAKRAVAAALGHAGPVAPADVEILPVPVPDCPRGHACTDGHPPGVTLRGELAARAGEARVLVSLSHTARVAVAVALIIGPRQEDEHGTA